MSLWRIQETWDRLVRAARGYMALHLTTQDFLTLYNLTSLHSNTPTVLLPMPRTLQLSKAPFPRMAVTFPEGSSILHPPVSLPP